MSAPNEPTEARLRGAYGDLAPGHGFEEGLRAALAETPQAPPRASPWPMVALAAAACVAAAVVLLPHDPEVVSTVGTVEAGDGRAERTARERAENRRAYEAAIGDLRRDAAGRWVAIAGGRVAATGGSLADVAAAAPEAAHRFVFQVGTEGDAEEDATTWYGPRFAGPKLLAALGLDWASGGFRAAVLQDAGGRRTASHGVPPFPRFPLSIDRPDRVPGAAAAPARDVFIGSVGPPLVLLESDWEELGLARFEVPGRMTVAGEPCRMALAEVSVPELGARGRVVAACADLPRQRLVEMARQRDAFWTWGWQLARDAVGGRDGKWVVFAADRVVGEGASLEGALEAARGMPDGCHHRYVVRLPRRAAARTFDESKFSTPGRDYEVLNDACVLARTSTEPSGEPEGGAWGTPLLVTAEVSAEIGLEMSEVGEDFFLLRSGKAVPVRGSYVWAGAGAGRVVRLALYPVPEAR